MSVPLRVQPRPKRKNKLIKPMLMLLLFFCLVAVTIWYWITYQAASTEHVAPYDGRQHVIVYQGEAFPQSFQLVDDQVLLPIDFIKEHIDPAIFWDEPTASVIVTTKDKVLRMPSEQVVAYLNKTPVDLKIPVKQQEGTVYIPYEPLEKLYPFQVQYVASTGTVIVEKAGYSVQQGKTADGEDQQEPQPLRTGPSRKQPIVGELAPGSEVDLLGEEAGWYRVQTADGLTGFLPKESVSLTQIRQSLAERPNEKQNAVWSPLGKPIVLAWEQVASKNPNTANIADMAAVNVVSPTWFELLDDKGTIGNKADPAYVKWAHSKGYKVWGLVTNGFNPDWTKAVLASYELREKMVAQILQYANMYDLDGINLDFENVYLDEKARLVQFVRELAPYLHEQGLALSMDVTIKSTSDRWSRFYDRAELAKVVDYMAVMTYDEHPAASQVSGSVASLPWVENGMLGVLEEVPREKLLLGVPFYTRLWKEVKQADGTVKVSSKALSMPTAQKWVEERKLTPQLDEATGQQFVSYKDPADGATYKMWLEDATSMEKRVALAKKYNLAGLAAWRRGYETDDIWTSIDKGFQQR